MSMSLDELTEHLYDVLRGELLSVGDEFTPDTNLVDAGLDSLAITQLLLSVEERTGIWVDEGSLTPETLESTRALARCVHEHLSQG